MVYCLSFLFRLTKLKNWTRFPRSHDTNRRNRSLFRFSHFFDLCCFTLHRFYTKMSQRSFSNLDIRKVRHELTSLSRVFSWWYLSDDKYHHSHFYLIDRRFLGSWYTYLKLTLTRENLWWWTICIELWFNMYYSWMLK